MQPSRKPYIVRPFANTEELEQVINLITPDGYLIHSWRMTSAGDGAIIFALMPEAPQPAPPMRCR